MSIPERELWRFVDQGTELVLSDVTTRSQVENQLSPDSRIRADEIRKLLIDPDAQPGTSPAAAPPPDGSQAVQPHPATASGTEIVGAWEELRGALGEIRRVLVDENASPRRTGGGPDQNGAGPRPAGKPDPHGVQIRGALIVGDLDLRGLAADAKLGLRLTACRLDGVLDLRDATLPWVELDTCVLPALRADRAQIGLLIVRNSLFTGDWESERLGLAASKIAGDAILDGTVFAPPGVAGGAGQPDAREGLWTIQGRELSVGGMLSMERSSVEGSEPAGPQPRAAASCGAVCLSGAQISGDLVLRRARLTSRLGAALLADYAAIKGDAFVCEDREQGFTAEGIGQLGVVCLAGCQVSGQVSMRGAVITNSGVGEEAGPALLADSSNITGAVNLDDRFVAEGAVRFLGATVASKLSLEGATVNATTPANGEGTLAAAVCLSSAQLGRLVLRRARLVSRYGSALMGDYVTVKGDAVLCEDAQSGFEATGSGALGAVCLAGATISGQLSMSGCALTNTGIGTAAGPALLADSSTITGNVYLDDRFEARGSVRFFAASIAAQLSLESATVTASEPVNRADPASAAAVCLSGAQVGRLRLRDATLASAYGPALLADNLTVKGDAFLCETPASGFTATGVGSLGAVCLVGASVNGQVSMLGSRVTNTGTGDQAGSGLVGDSATIQGDVRLDGGFRAESDVSAAAVTMVEASIGRELRLSEQPRDRVAPAGWNPNQRPARHKASVVLARAKVGTLRLERAANAAALGTGGFYLWDLDGLTYTGMPWLFDEPPADCRRWTSLLGAQAPYAAQPYQALAAAYEGTGDDLSARRVLVAQRDDARRRGGLKPRTRVFQFVLKWLIGYGYRSIWAFAWLALLFAVMIAIAVLIYRPGHDIVWQPAGTGATTPAAASSAPVECPVSAAVGYAINVAFPIINLGDSTEQMCTFASGRPASAHDTGTTGNARFWVLFVDWTVRALSATVLGFYAAGLTGLTRTPPSG